MDWDEKQQEAIASCCDITKRVVAVTGSAGTGKTSIMKVVHDNMVAAGYKVALAAPTGKAAKRIYEATGIKARTNHLLLEYSSPGEPDPKTGKTTGVSVPRRGRDNPLEYDVLLIDEYSMVNHELHRNLFDAIGRSGVVRVFGDTNQLQPIETAHSLKGQPSPFMSLLAKFQGTYLNINHRQDEGSGIATNGLAIQQGKMPRRLPDFNINVTDYPVTTLKELCLESLEQGVDYSELDNQIIVPMNKSWVGTKKLNTMLQGIFRPERDGWYDLPRETWDKEPVRVRVGDKVLITKNNYDIRPEDERGGIAANGEHVFIKPDPELHAVFNGETGIIIDISEFGEIIIDLGDRVVTIPPELPYKRPESIIVYYDPRKAIDLAYAITTHKSQGSEYKHVTYLINRSHTIVLNRRNFYTAISRARKHVNVITDQTALNRSLYRKGDN